MLVRVHFVLILVTNVLIINDAQCSNEPNRFFSWKQYTWKPEYMETDFDSLEDTRIEESIQGISRKDYSNDYPDKQPVQWVQRTKLLKEKNKLFNFS